MSHFRVFSNVVKEVGGSRGGWRSSEEEMSEISDQDQVHMGARLDVALWRRWRTSIRRMDDGLAE